MRVGEESAEAIVAKKRGKLRGAKGRRTTKQTIPTTFMETRQESSETDGRCHGGSPPGRWWSGMPVDSGRRRHCGKRARPRAVEEEKVLNGMQEKAFSSFCGEQHRRVQPPDAEDRTSGGVGGVTGAIPLPRPAQNCPTLKWVANLPMIRP